jgi:hypothetical protein
LVRGSGPQSLVTFDESAWNGGSMTGLVVPLGVP